MNYKLVNSNMKKFETPVIETISFEWIDVIATSRFDVDDNGFNNQVVKP